MSEVDPSERILNFDEAALGYTEDEAASEAQRCIACKNAPCVSGCPVGVDIPAFLRLLSERKFEEAYAVITETSCLPAVCGRVCPQETQCEGSCTRGRNGDPVAIGGLERFLADRFRDAPLPSEILPAKNRRVAVVGSGPAGLACAGELVRRGYPVTVFEALHEAGGVLAYGIPAFRLPKDIVRREVEKLRALGVEFVCDAVIGKSLHLFELLGEEGFDAVFLGTGAGLPRFLGIAGEGAAGVFSANEYLTRINLMRAYEEGAKTPIYRARHAVVVGGGNVAMDAARCARRLGAEVTVVYRRSEEELPARREEVIRAKEEGIAFRFLASPVEILSENGRVSKICCEEMALGEAEGGRRVPVGTGKLFSIGTDCVILALGTSPNLLAADGLKRGTHGILVDADGRTSMQGVFAGGDAVTGSATVILAMGAGKRAAAAIDEYLSAL